MTLQRVVAGWDSIRLDPLLSGKLSQLEGLQWRAPKPVAALVGQYRDALALFLRQRNASGGASTLKNEMMPNAKVLVRKTVRQLEGLDRARARLAQQPVPPEPPASDRAASQRQHLVIHVLSGWLCLMGHIVAEISRRDPSGTS